MGTPVIRAQHRMGASTGCPKRCCVCIVQESSRQSGWINKFSCAALRALALNSREQLIREQRENPELHPGTHLSLFRKSGR
ncbi:hypothetical protein TNCV_2501351 [Trichonephila clavipes]|nr:hypothetical protein TNCV_2501351 [Trichonephila clavipes]